MKTHKAHCEIVHPTLVDLANSPLFDRPENNLMTMNHLIDQAEQGVDRNMESNKEELLIAREVNQKQKISIQINLK